MKKFASFLLAALLVIMTFPMIMTGASAAELSAADQAAVAAGTPFKVGDAYFANMPAALDAAAEGDTIYQLADYAVPARENWSMKGKNITLDMQGFKITDGYKEGSNIGRIINFNCDGTTALNGDTKGNASELTIKNGTYDVQFSVAFQIYAYMKLTLDNVNVTCHETTGSCFISQNNSVLTIKNSEICGMIPNPETACSSNSTGNAFRPNSTYAEIYVSDSYIYSDGGTVKFQSGGAKIAFTNCEIETGYQEAFINDQGDNTLTVDNCVVNMYTKGNNDVVVADGETTLKATGAIAMYGNRGNITFNDSTVTVNNMDVNQSVVSFQNASGKTGIKFTATNTNFIAKGGRGVFAGGDVDFNMYGGSIVADSRALISTTVGSQPQARVAFYGTKITTNMADVAADAFAGTNPLSGAVMVSGCTSVDFNNVEFTANCADGVTPWATSPVIVAWAGAKDKVNVNGGKYVGGSAFLVRYAYSGDSEAPLDAENSVVYSYADGKNSAILSPEVVEGASIRTADKSGIRFSTNISADAIEFAKAAGAELSFGTVIVPVDYLADIDFITIENLEAAGKKYLDIKADAGIIENADGSVTINAAMIDILPDNYDREFVATAYIKYTVDEVDYYIWANPSIEDNARSIEAVAYAALADVTATATDAYATAVTEYYVYENGAYKLVTGTAYSRYSATQITAIKAYLA